MKINTRLFFLYKFNLTNSVIILADKNLSSKNIYNIVDTYKPDFIFNLKKDKIYITYEIFRFIENQIILKKQNIISKFIKT